MKKKHLKVLEEIQDSIPQELLMNLTKKVKQYHSLKQVVEHALTLPIGEGEGYISAKQKRKLQSLLDSGYLEEEVEILDTSVEKQIERYLEKNIERAVKEGRLPKKAPVIKHKSAINKGKQYARRKQKQLKALFEAGDEGTSKGDDREDKEESHARADDVTVLPIPGVERGGQAEEGEDRIEGLTA